MSSEARSFNLSGISLLHYDQISRISQTCCNELLNLEGERG